MIKNIKTLQETDRILLDANVCLFIFGPPQFRYGNPNSNKYYESQDKWGKDTVHICSPVLSEFVNRCIHHHWKRWKIDTNPREKGKKDFRNSQYYKEEKIAETIAQDVYEMLNSVECCDSDFDKAKTYAFLSEFKKGEMDFNDIIIGDICAVNNLALVTDDGDFKNSSIQIFTANL